MYSVFYLIVVAVGILLCFHEIIADIDIERDAKLSTPELITVHGYPSEVHHIKTEDGYILEVHRIANPGKRPVLLMHGMLDSSATFVMLGPGRSLGYILHDMDYDVWLSNSRGNDYSKRHVKYHPNGTREERKKYWNFSWHEIGTKDLPATIDYILKKSNYSQLHYIGHSQGTTAFFVMTSERPEYNEKILSMTAMAPAVYMGHVDNEILILISRYLSSIETVAEWISFYEFSRQANQLLVQTQNSVLCYIDALRTTQLCNNNFSPLVGNITGHVNRTLIPMFQTHAPAGSSMKQLFHYGQLIRSHRFCQYDYGLQRNLRIYQHAVPPKYNLKNCTAKVAIIYSENDTTVAAEDIRSLSKVLPNLLEIRRVDDDTFNHIDFIWASDAKELVYDYIIGWMKSLDDRHDSDNE
ncbi:lipase 1-like [Contarinia nasturtii]|uniref:lipase 1-like n=1 Tax=Contarinia nasturtii TaxID=265458 RepID=UPI0012D46654|nr:lipase 1-like [Contarinia nasturtii]